MQLERFGAQRAIARDARLVETLSRVSVAGPRWPGLLDVLRPGSRYGVAGAIGGPLVELDVRTLYLKDLNI